LIYIASAFVAESQIFTFKNINHKNGLILSSVLSLAQDKEGYIWIGTDGAGLQRFDGKTVKSIAPRGNSEHHVSHIDCTKDAVYFSSKYYGFYSYKNNKINLVYVDELFGENLAIKKLKNSICLIGQKKISILKNAKIFKTFEIQSENYNNHLVQIIELNNAILVLGNKFSFYMDENTILPVNEWLNISEKKAENISFGRFYQNKLELFDLKNNRKINVFLNNFGTIFSIKKESFENYSNQKSIYKAFSRGMKVFLLDSENELFQYRNSLKYIPKNSNKQNFSFETVFVDINYDFWATTLNQGVYKISNEPFTKIELHQAYQNPLISFVFRTKDNEVILSDYNNKTYISSFKNVGFKEIDLRIYSQTIYNNSYYFATNKGVYYLKNQELFPLKNFPKNKVIYLFAHENMLFFSEENKGLQTYNFLNNKIEQIILQKDASHVYTSQLNHFKTKVYFGTNNGIFEYNLLNKSVRDMNHKFKLTGSYSGVSTKDIYGNLWFSLDKQLIGITKREDFITISNKNYFISTLFYNLIADDYGNLIVGTNSGVSKLNLDPNGNVLNSTHYFDFNGFDGYETHMRSNFKSGKTIYIGTIEGLFAINTENLENLPNPPKPIIYQDLQISNSNLNSDEDLIKINYLAINPKLKGIQYSYRLKGKTRIWSDLTNKTEAYFSNLSDQEYIFQVKSTFDGLNFSPVANYKIVKQTPIWKSKWFILFLILSIALANIIVLDRTKSFEVSQIIDNQNIEINNNNRSIILAFGFVAVTASHFIAIFLNNALKNTLFLNFLIALILLFLFLISISKNKFIALKKHLLKIALFSILIHSYLGAFLTNIQPIYVVVISLCTALTPFILNKIKEVIFFSIFHILSAIFIVFLAHEPVYNEILFLIAVIVSVSLSIFTTYIRNESLQKLIFISGIINKGNILAIAFNQENKITYISENCYQTLKIDSTKFLGKEISELNQFIFTSKNKEKLKFESLFQEEKNLIIPMIGKQTLEIWTEWSCKVFNKNIKVIFGQDVTERITLENNYESLIENAEDLIYTVDVNGNFLFVNNKFQDVLDYKTEELLGRNSLFLIGKDNENKIRRFYEEQFKSRLLNTYNEFPIRKKDGTEIWIGQNTTILYELGSNKKVKGFLALGRDITEKRNQQNLIKNQNENITSSINYAKKIQFNLLPSKQKFDSIFEENSIYFKPKDIVSGDFYWLEENNDKIFFVLGDCTGHGVPGSFMTLLGINLLNQIIAENHIVEPGEVLKELDTKLVQILPREGDSSLRDGMEIVIFVYDKLKKSAKFACAGGKFISISNQEILVHRGESKHIGDLPEANFLKYNTYEVSQESKEFYFFSDGIQDQFGKLNDKKFTFKRLLDILEKNKNTSVETKVNEIKNKFQIWKKDSEQTDDITFIGIKFY
jgi:PAS domain S-box-containing protein